MACSIDSKEIEFINELEGDYDRYVRAKLMQAEQRRMKETERAAKSKGYYVKAEDRVSTYVEKYQELVGKELTMEDIDGGPVETIKIESIRNIGGNTARVNGEYDVDMKNNMLTNGNKYVTLGSEGSFSKEGATMLKQITGSVMADMDRLMQEAEELDGEAADPRLKAVVELYKEVLSNAGQDVKLDVKMYETLEDVNTKGEANWETGEVEILAGNTSYNSHADIIVHEVQHVMIHGVLKNDRMLSNEVLKLRNLVRDAVSWEVFLPKDVDKDSATSETIEFAKARWNYVFSNDTKEANASEFLAAATTNVKLMDALEMVKDPEGMTLVGKVEIKAGEKSKWKKSWNKLAELINKVFRSVKWQGKNGQIMAAELLDTALRMQYKSKRKEDQSIVQKAIDKVMQADKKVNAFMSRQSKTQKTYEENLMSRDKDKLSKAMRAIWDMRALSKARSYVVQNAIFSSVTRDLSNPDMARFYQMFRYAKSFVENAVAPMKQAAINVLADDYKMGELAVESRRALKRVLIDTDGGVLGSVADIQKYLEDETLIDKELDEFAVKFDGDVVVAVEALGEMLVTNRMTIARGYSNAAQIGHDFLGMQTGKDVKEIDKAATLVALKKSSKENKKLALEAMKSHPEGVQHGLDVLEANKKELLKKAYADDAMYLIKGAKQEAYNGDKQYYIVDEKEMKDLQKAKYTVVGKHTGLSRAVGKNLYLVIGENVDPGYTEGLLSKVQLRNEGESLRNLLQKLGGMTLEEAEDKVAEMAETTGLEDEADALIPERSGMGLIYDYRLRIPHDVKSKHMAIEDDFIKTVGETVGNLSHKQEAMVNNRASLEYFDKFYKKYSMDPDFRFVEISEKSKGKYKEYWDNLPYYMKQDIKSKMNGKLMVEEGLLVDFFGYKNVSIVNAPIIRDRKKLQLVARKIEKILQELTQAWKHSIVAKSSGTIIGNTSSNMIVALAHTEHKSIPKYLDDFVTTWKAMNQYQEMKKEVMKLDIRMKAGEKVDMTRYKDLKAQMETSPIYPIMRDGQYSVILEDIDREWFNDKGIIEENLDNLLNKAKMKGSNIGLKEIVDVLYVRKDSPMYGSVMKLTTYADAINKVIIFNALKKQGEEEQDILNYVDQLHVNYSYLDNRWIKYANDLDVLSFTKYFFRVLPAMVKMAGRKSVSMFLLEGSQYATGIDVETPLDQFYSPWDSMTRKVGGIFDPMNIFEHLLTPAIAK